MKKSYLLLLIFLLIIRLLYPHSRFGYQNSPLPENGRHLNVETVTLAPGEKVSVYLVGILRIANYSSSDFRVADVNSFGTVEAKRPGTAIIYVEKDEKTYRCKIKVQEDSSK